MCDLTMRSVKLIEDYKQKVIKLIKDYKQRVIKLIKDYTNGLRKFMKKYNIDQILCIIYLLFLLDFFCIIDPHNCIYLLIKVCIQQLFKFIIRCNISIT